MSTYLENERAFSANVFDYLVIMLNLVYLERKKEKGESGRGEKREEGRREDVVAVWVSLCICSTDASFWKSGLSVSSFWNITR